MGGGKKRVNFASRNEIFPVSNSVNDDKTNEQYLSPEQQPIIINFSFPKICPNMKINGGCLRMFRRVVEFYNKYSRQIEQYHDDNRETMDRLRLVQTFVVEFIDCRDNMNGEIMQMIFSTLLSLCKFFTDLEVYGHYISQSHNQVDIYDYNNCLKKLAYFTICLEIQLNKLNKLNNNSVEFPTDELVYTNTNKKNVNFDVWIVKAFLSLSQKMISAFVTYNMYYWSMFDMKVNDDINFTLVDSNFERLIKLNADKHNERQHRARIIIFNHMCKYKFYCRDNPDWTQIDI